MTNSPWSHLRHDLRTPINTVIGYAELLMEQLTAAGQTEGLVELQEIVTAGHTLLQIVPQVLPPDGKPDGLRVQRQLRQEMRSPINAILGYCELLLEHHPSNLGADVATIQAATQQLRTLINHLEQWSPTERSPSMAPLSVKPAVSSPAATHSAAKNPPPHQHPALLSSDITTSPHSGHILVVDDNINNRTLLTQLLMRQQYTADTATNGRQALQQMETVNYDLVLLDIIMPELDGYEVLRRIKADRRWTHIPIIMISALDDIESVVQCIEQGADDYLPKPFSPVLLRARIGACLEKKRLRDQELIYLKEISQAHEEITQLSLQLAAENQQLNQLNGQLQHEQDRTEKLLLNIFPAAIAEELKQDEHLIANYFDNVTILFADLVDFTKLATDMPPKELVTLLNQIFSHFDRLAEQYGLEKIKTIGDAYMVVGGLPTAQENHANLIAEMAIAMQESIKQFKQPNGHPFSIRIGINTGSVVAGVIGLKKFIYDLWGDAVNVASRMESQGLVGQTQVTEATYQRLRQHYQFEYRGIIQIKGRGLMPTYLLKGKKL